MKASMTTSFTHDTSPLAETYDRLSDSQFEGGKRLVERLGVAPATVCSTSAAAPEGWPAGWPTA
jgi:hypothetical protein